MELRHLRYFVALAEELNFHRAAERLHIAQPALSRQIRELEEEIGAKLFHRTSRRVELTPTGKWLLSRAFEILERMEQTRIGTQMTAIGREGELPIGFNGTVTDLIPTLKAYRARFPHVGIILNQMNSSMQIKALHENQIDIGVVTIPVYSSKIRTRPLIRVPFKVILPANHPLSAKPAVSVYDLKDETFIIPPQPAAHIYYDTIMSLFRNVGLTPHIMMEAQDLHTIMLLVMGGMGVTLTPSPIRPFHGLVQKPIDGMDLSLQVSLIWHVDSKSEVLEQFLDFFFGSYYSETDNSWL